MGHHLVWNTYEIFFGGQPRISPAGLSGHSRLLWIRLHVCAADFRAASGADLCSSMGGKKTGQNGDLNNKHVALKQQKCGFNQQKC